MRYSIHSPVMAWMLLLVASLYVTTSTISTSILAEARNLRQHSSRNEQSFIGVNAGGLRRARLEDANDIADILISAFWVDPSYRYGHPFLEKYRDEHQECTRQLIVKELEKSKNNTAQTLIEVVDMESNGYPTVVRPVAVAFWALPGFFAPFGTLQRLAGCTDRSQNLTRIQYLEGQLKPVVQKYLVGAYGSHQLYLNGLGTHPDYQGRGAASQLLRKGFNLAAELDVAVTLVATMAGEPVYTHLGFESIANVSVHEMEDGLSFPYDVMVRDSSA